VVGKVRLSPSVERPRHRRWWDAAIAAGACAGGLLHARPGRWRRPGRSRYDALLGPDRL